MDIGVCAPINRRRLSNESDALKDYERVDLRNKGGVMDKCVQMLDEKSGAIRFQTARREKRGDNGEREEKSEIGFESEGGFLEKGKKMNAGGGGRDMQPNY
ncbi:hypothetical protein TNCV_2984011 [Trichonephila clavipes]|nr:hypothetical protein TNCV_2984011 [Trichonephila clavipes]